MGFPERLFQYRKAEKLSQKELAEKMGVSQRTISSWETGRNEPSLGDLSKLSKIFGCTLASITDTRERAVGEISVEDIYEKLRELNSKELIEIDRKIKAELHYKREKEQLEQEKKRLQSQIEAMQKQLENLEKNPYSIYNFRGGD